MKCGGLVYFPRTWEILFSSSSKKMELGFSQSETRIFCLPTGTVELSYFYRIKLASISTRELWGKTCEFFLLLFLRALIWGGGGYCTPPKFFIGVLSKFCHGTVLPLAPCCRIVDMILAWDIGFYGPIFS